MENPQRRRADGQKPKLSQVFFNNDRHIHSRYEIFGKGGDRSNRLVLLCLGLLNVVLLIVAVILGINCAKVRESSLPVSHSAAANLINELESFRSNHSDVMEAKEEARSDLETARQNHAQLQKDITQKRNTNDIYQRQIVELQREKINLQSNITALEGSCGRCLPKWIFYNSSCYFFSYLESKAVRKNWPDSRADCISRGADLIVINSTDEQKFVASSIEHMQSRFMSRSYGYWIGLTDMEIEGTWVWINNVTETEERYWKSGEPDDDGIMGQDCGATVYSSSNPWNTRMDSNCESVKTHWICKVTPS